MIVGCFKTTAETYPGPLGRQGKNGVWFRSRAAITLQLKIRIARNRALPHMATVGTRSQVA